jgi:uncharacterized membrane protein
MNHNRILWVLQWLFGLYFIAVGVMHFIVPEGLPQMMEWMYDLDPSVHYIVGVAEILGGLGLILPAVTGKATGLVPLAALGLVVVMVGALIWHAPRAEALQMGNNAFLALVMLYIAYGRWRLAPLVP